MPLLGLWDARQERHWTQAELAERVGLRRETISRLERGLEVPKGETVKRLADGLATTLDKLVQPPVPIS
jgi:transcriptional regulator with XRE-family HTH domain